MSGKRIRAAAEKFERGKAYELDQALGLVKDTASAKFDESVEVAVNLGIDARKSDQGVRGATVMPHGTGKTARVAVFAQGAQAEEARKAGADRVGLEDIADDVKKGKIDFDVLIAAPDAMKVVGQLGKVLGPRGLMPNPKVGTVTAKVGEAVKNAKAGQVKFRNDKAGIVHCAIGKASFSAQALKENFLTLLGALHKARPASAKGQYLKRVTLSTTMGPGIRVERASLPGN